MYKPIGKIKHPDYGGERDEIIRDHIEREFEDSIVLDKCTCGSSPKEMFKSCRDYFVMCDKCKRKTSFYRHMYEAKQAWNMEVCNGQAVNHI